MSKAITKEYLIANLHNFEDQILDNKYIQGVKVGGIEVTPGSDHKVDITIPAAVQYKIAEQSVAETGYLKTYTLQANTGAGGAYEDVTGAAKINIPKDFLVKSVTLETCATADVPVAGYVPGDKYIDFVINTVDDDETGTHIYLLVSDLIDVYTAGNGIDITTGEISVVAKTNGGLAVDANGVYIDFEDTNIDFSDWDNYSV